MECPGISGQIWGPACVSSLVALIAQRIKIGGLQLVNIAGKSIKSMPSPHLNTRLGAHAQSPLEILDPQVLSTPLVFASPHSGSQYPEQFVLESLLDVDTLRKSEDCYVDELFAGATNVGAPLIRALYPRAYLDVNREPYELDPTMFEDELPDYTNATSARVAAGLGTIARIVSTRREIYRKKLRFEEAERRINSVYRPYHAALKGLLHRASNRFGYCVLVDCHSMPSTGLPLNIGSQSRCIDFVLGDRTGLSCSAQLTDAVDSFLTSKGYRVIRNNPYAGGFTTQHYGDPANGTHAIQIEINRNIYMDEVTLQRKPSFRQLQSDMHALISHVASFAARHWSELQYQRQSAE